MIASRGSRRTLTVVLGAAWTSAALAAGACRPAAPNLDSPGTAIVCLGDSITAGVGADPGRGFPEALASLLGTPVINASVPGDTAAAGLARLDQVLAADPWLVVVELGGNDILRQVPVEQTEQDLGTILDRLLAARVVPVLVAVEGPFGGAHGRMFDRLAGRYRVPVVRDALRRILFDPALKSDEIHPNTRGHELLAAAVADTLRPLLRAHQRRRAGAGR